MSRQRTTGGLTWATLAVGAGSVLCGACRDNSGPSTPQVPDSVAIGTVSFSAESLVAGEMLVTEATASNVVTDSAHIEILGGGCRTRMKVFRASARAAPPAWDHDLWSPNCGDPAFRINLGIGESLRFADSLLVLSILGDSLPEGRYFLTVRLRHAGVDYEVVAGDVVLRR